MDYDLTIQFVDDNLETCELQLNKQTFIDKCKRMHLNYFTKMLNQFKESTMSSIRIKVPYATGAAQFVMSYMDGARSSNANELIKRIHCEDFFGMDTTRSFAKLFNFDSIDPETYDLAHEFIEQKLYSEKLYIKFMAEKLPTNYDCSKFTKEFVNAMIESTRHNFLVTHNDRIVFIYDTTANTVRKLKCNININSIVINMAYPIIAVKFNTKIVLYDIFTTTTIKEISYESQSSISTVSFSTSGKFMYVCARKTIYRYQVKGFKLISSYPIGFNTGRIVSSPDDTILVFSQSYSSKKNWLLHIFDMQSGSTTKISTGWIRDMGFVDNATLIYYNYILFEDESIVKYDCKIQKKYPIKRTSKFATPSYFNRLVYSPHNDIFLEHFGNYFSGDKTFDTIVFKDDAEIGQVKLGSNRGTFSCCCFSYHSKYLYHMSDRTYNKIAKYIVNTDGTMNKIKEYPLETTNQIFGAKSIINAKYADPKLLAKVQHLL